ncbi:MAG: hypothetical protein KA764_18380, partial [Anaerolineales bacterium]|nr:hypothetical protein [Anaerolineales bacterium]
MRRVAGFPPGVTRAGLWGAAGLALGAVCAALPPAYSALVLGGAALLAVSVWEPAVGVGAALVLGPSRAYLAAAGYFGPQFDLGQIFFALALAGWLARGALRREIVIPPLGLYLPLAGWIVIGLLSLFGAPAWQDGLNEAIKWIEVAVLIALVRAEAQRGRAGWIVGAVLLAGALQAGLGLWQFGLRGAGPASFQLPDGHFRAYGTFEQPNPFGGFLGLIWPVAAGLAGGWRPAGPAGGWRCWALPAVGALTAGLLLAGLYASFSRGAWLGAGAAALVLVLAWPRRRAVGLALAAGGLAGAGLLAAAGLLPASVTARLASVVDFAAVTDVRGAHITDANFALVERLA